MASPVDPIINGIFANFYAPFEALKIDITAACVGIIGMSLIVFSFSLFRWTLDNNRDDEYGFNRSDKDEYKKYKKQRYKSDLRTVMAHRYRDEVYERGASGRELKSKFDSLFDNDPNKGRF